MAFESRITAWYGKEVFDKATEANIRAMGTAAGIVELDVKQNFTLKGTGRASVRQRGAKIRIAKTTSATDRRFKKREDLMHRASLPGQPPAIDMGVLRSSIMSSVEVGVLGVIGKVGPDIEHIAEKASFGTDVNYGFYLERGTKHIAKRPFLVPALARKRKEINRIFRKTNGS